MIRENRGHVVNMASSLAFAGTVQVADYCASKAGVYTFNEALRLELKDAGIRGVKTTVVCTGKVNTGMFKGVQIRFPFLTPTLRPESVASQVVGAVCRGDEEVWAPLFVRGVPLLRLLPTPIYDWLQGLIGVTSGMKGFRGRTTAAK